MLHRRTLRDYTWNPDLIGKDIVHVTVQEVASHVQTLIFDQS